MNLKPEDQKQWSLLTSLVDTEQRSDPHFHLKTEFRMDDPQVRQWMHDTLAPSLLEGDAGVKACLASVEQEKDAVLRALKVYLLQRWWGEFDQKTSDEVVEHLLGNGLERDTVRVMVLDSHFPPEPSQAQLDEIRNKLAEVQGIDPEDITLEVNISEPVMYH